MKRKIAFVIIVLSLTVMLTAPVFKAAGNICFTAIEAKLEPLDDNKMPAIIDSLLYIPSVYFASEELGIYNFTNDDKALLYNSSKRLIFDTVSATVLDQDGNQQNIPAIKKNGRIYVPVDEICIYFGIRYQVISSDLAPVLRFYRGSIFIDQYTFLDMNKNVMQTYYDEYIGYVPKVSETPTFENVTVFLSFYDLAPQNFETILDALSRYRYKCTFFVSADEIATDAGLLRRAAGAGHTIGIWLEEGTYDEYQQAYSLLFEATKISSVIVSAEGDIIKIAEETARAEGLVFWNPIKSYNGSDKITISKLTGQLSGIDSSRISINLVCTDKMGSLAGSLFGYLSEKKYVVRRVTETTSPTYSIG